ncbi:MBL fold metallo-hydrolase [Ideonella livida]|uniref:MBL fold metallo-hydrolase n=1 Tax=Ideonella livida TaxID=2707176 RepID=A0A7C9PHY5_9BURK|nr:MBL fold metallo-hydrolase [Ideonella livida]NDY92475.1 MBL fold metallo-hydrolase [Ideonella livida]
MTSALNWIRRATAAFTLGVVAAGPAAAQAPAAPATPAALSLRVHNTEAGSFHVNAVVLSGSTESLLIDTGFSRADALRIAALVLESGKPLTTILVSQADPDFYFGTETLQALFPQARVVSTPAVREKIQAKMVAKLAFWGPKLGANAPRQPVLPEALTGTTLLVDGQAVELRGTTGLLAHRPYVWVPSLRAVVGALGVFGQLHVWTADTQTLAERQAWTAQLDEMLALRPAVVVPGHMAAGTPLDLTSIAHTQAYLRRFEAEAARAADAAALNAAMRQAYPGAGLTLALDIGAKVAKGEMKW